MFVSSNEIRLANFLFFIKELYDNSINKFASNHQINVNQYYAIVRGERPFGEKMARNVERLMGLESGKLDLCSNENNELHFECPLIIEGEPIPKNPMTSKLKKKLTYEDLPTAILEQLGISKNSLFVVELRTSLFSPIFNERGVYLVECFSGYFVSNKYYLFNNKNNLFIYKVEVNITTIILFDSKNKAVLKLKKDEQNSILKSAIGRLRYGIIGGIV